MTLMDRRRALMAAKNSGKSDMSGWTDGVAYTDLTIINGSYYNTSGGIAGYPGWKRTGYVPCDGASSITFPPMTGAASTTWNWFFDVGNAPVSNFAISKTQYTSIPVPANAAFFGISNDNSSMDACITAGIVPHA